MTSRLASHELLRSLGRGGMAEVLLARASGPHGFQKLVVLKRILPELARNPRYVQLFLDEAKLVACLDHPNIAQVHDVGQIDGEYCCVMEYVHGRNLEKVLRACTAAATPLPISHIVQIGRDLAAALHHAHEKCAPDGAPLEIVHRDVSPSNIQISYDGVVKLLDFGVARAANASIRTRTGVVKGKDGYMSPEQARGERVDRRTDVFSLGIVLWEAVTGRTLYEGAHALAIRERVLTVSPPPPSSVRRDCPPELAAIILRALARQPEARYQTTRDLQLDLEELARERKLGLSSLALSGFMHQLFPGDRDEPPAVDPSRPTVTDAFKVEDATRKMEPGDLARALAEAAKPSSGETRVMPPDELARMLAERSQPALRLVAPPPATPAKATAPQVERTDVRTQVYRNARMKTTRTQPRVLPLVALAVVLLVLSAWIARVVLYGSHL